MKREKKNYIYEILRKILYFVKNLVLDLKKIFLFRRFVVFCSLFKQNSVGNELLALICEIKYG